MAWTLSKVTLARGHVGSRPAGAAGAPAVIHRWVANGSHYKSYGSRDVSRWVVP